MSATNPVFDLGLLSRMPPAEADLCRQGRHEDALLQLTQSAPSPAIQLLQGRILRHANRHLDGAGALSHAYAAEQQNMEIAAEFGLSLVSIGRQEDGLILLRHAVEQRPDLVWACIELSRLLYAQDDAATALFFLDRSKALVPLQPALWFNAGQIRARLDDLSGARDDLSRAISLNPDDSEILHEYCCLLVRTGHFREAMERHQRLSPSNHISLEVYSGYCADLADLLSHAGRPGFAASLLVAAKKKGAIHTDLRLGIAYLDSHQEESALPLLQKVHDQAPTRESKESLCLCQALCHQPEQAIALLDQADQLPALIARMTDRHCYNRAFACILVALNIQHDQTRQTLPTIPVLQALAGNIKIAAARYAEALPFLASAYTALPGQDDILNNYLVALVETGQPGKAADIANIARKQRPLSPIILTNLASALQRGSHWHESKIILQEVLNQAPNHLQALLLLLHAQLHLCDWQEIDENTQHLITRLKVETDEEALSGLDLFALNSLPVDDSLRSKIARAHRHMTKAPSMPDAPVKQQDDGKPLHIGWISPDFREHSLGKFVLPIIEELGKGDMHHSAWSLSMLPPDTITARYEKACHQFTQIADLPADRAARLIRDADVDILVDLAGPTRGNRPDIIALRPARYHLHAFGFGDRTGISGIDGLITDRMNIPPENASRYDEALHYLPHCFMSGSRVPDNPTLSRSEENLPEDGIVFASFNAHTKFHPEGFALWAEIVKQIPGSRLWLLEGQPQTRFNLEKASEQAGIRDRLVFAARKDWLAHRQRLQLADIMLDCLYHSGGATTVDALWAGVPVITMAGNTQASRVSASCLQHCRDQDRMIAQNPEHYAKLACTLARDTKLLKAIRTQLLNERDTSPLFDPALHARSLEKLFIDIMEHAC